MVVGELHIARFHDWKASGRCGLSLTLPRTVRANVECVCVVVVRIAKARSGGGGRCVGRGCRVRGVDADACICRVAIGVQICLDLFGLISLTASLINHLLLCNTIVNGGDVLLLLRVI